MLTAVAFGCAIFLSLTVLNRGTENLYREHIVIMPWIDQGYFHLGGQRWIDGTIKSTYSWFYLFPAFLLQKLHFMLTGEFSYRLMAIYNQVILAVSSLAVGLLAHRCAICLGQRRLDAIAGAVCVICVYQTFPWNIATYFRIYPTNFWIIFACLYLCIMIDEVAGRRRRSIARDLSKALLVFAMFYSEHIASFMLLSSMLLLLLFLRPAQIDLREFIITMAVPVGAAATLFLGALVYVKAAFPTAAWTGSTLSFRTGFDGDQTYYTTLWALFDRDRYLPTYLHFGKKPVRLANWYGQFLMGVASFGFLVVALSRERALAMRRRLVAVTVVLGSLALQYVLFAALLSNAAITHPFGYDHYLAAPLIIAAFVVLPSLASRKIEYSRWMQPVTLTAAFVVVMAQMRAFAVAFPL